MPVFNHVEGNACVHSQDIKVHHNNQFQMCRL